MPQTEMKIELIAVTPNAEKVIEESGRTCYASFDKITENTFDTFIRAAVNRGHFSILEHASATFRISGISRACSHQLVRHRIASYSQQSQRYVRADDFDYVIPYDIMIDKYMYREFIAHMAEISKLYKYYIGNGIKPENARFILPNACATEIVMTMNFRSWREFLQKRLDVHAQWEIRNLATCILEKLSEIAPSCFEDIKKPE